VRSLTRRRPATVRIVAVPAGSSSSIKRRTMSSTSPDAACGCIAWRSATLAAVFVSSS